MSQSSKSNQPAKDWQLDLYTIIFEADTKFGKVFDVVLLWAILLSTLVVMLESVASIQSRYGVELRVIEWILTILFTFEYFLRISCVRSPVKYVFSFFGVIDLLAILPTYFGLFLVDAHSLLIIRVIRLLRVFRVLKLVRFVKEISMLMKAVRDSRRKVIVFLLMILTMAMILGTLMYLIEGDQSGFTSIPKAMYWAIVTMTTVGYGDIAPQSVLGQIVASLVMLLGYAIIIIPTGIFSVELFKAALGNVSNKNCPHCKKAGHTKDALYCHLCGKKF